ncbi:hypothetical protein D3C75_853560 [compost metagenome]
MAVGFNNCHVIGNWFQQSFNLQAVHSCLQQNMQILKDADIVGAHNMCTIDILINREFLIPALRLNQE